MHNNLARALTAVALLMSGTVSAAPMVLTATSLAATTSGFTVNFNDADSDSKLDLGEITGFSGIIEFGTDLYDVITTVPDIPSVADCSTVAPFCQNWVFENSGFPGVGIAPPVTLFTYRLEGTPVPEPATLALLGLGLAGLGFSRRKNA